MTILDRYIGRHVLYGTFVVLVILLGLFGFFGFMAKLGDIGKGHFGLYQALKYMVLSMPKDIYEMFPMAVLLGTTLGLSSMAVDSELVAMRAAGVSLFQVVGSVMKVGMVFIIASVLVGEFIAPMTESWARRDRAEALGAGIQQENGIWLREGPDFVNIGEVMPDLTLSRIMIYRFDPQQHHLLRQTYAKTARYERRGIWELRGVRESTFHHDEIVIHRRPEELWHSVLHPGLLSVFAVNPQSLPAWKLYRYIRHLRENKQNTSHYRLAFWFKVISPFTTAVMVVLAIPFVFTEQRSAGMGSRLFVGVMLGLAFYVLNRGFGFFSLLHGVPPLVGATLPTLVFFGLALVMLKRVR